MDSTLRTTLAAIIEQLIDIVDGIDGDIDLEAASEDEVEMDFDDADENAATLNRERAA